MKQLTQNYKLFEEKKSRTDEVIERLMKKMNPERIVAGFKPLPLSSWKAVVFKNPYFRRDIGELDMLIKHETTKKINYILFPK